MLPHKAYSSSVKCFLDVLNSFPNYLIFWVVSLKLIGYRKPSSNYLYSKVSFDSCALRPSLILFVSSNF